MIALLHSSLCDDERLRFDRNSAISIKTIQWTTVESVTKRPTVYGNGMVFVSEAITHAECSLRLKKMVSCKITFFKVD